MVCPTFPTEVIDMCRDCEKLHEQLQEQAGIMFGLRKTISNLRGEVRYERREKEKLIKEKKKNQKPPLRKGQKRGKYGRNG
jgi:hypothetical protein